MGLIGFIGLIGRTIGRVQHPGDPEALCWLMMVGAYHGFRQRSQSTIVHTVNVPTRIPAPIRLRVSTMEA